MHINLRKTKLMIFLVLALMTSGCAIINKSGVTKMQKGMVSYLESTYKKEFIVDKPKMEGNEGFGYSPVAMARRKDLPEVEFQVTYYKNNNTYDDNYLGYLWSYQGSLEVKKRLKEVYGEDLPLLYRFNINDKSLKDLNYDEVSKKYGDKALVEIYYCKFVDSKFDRNTESEKVLNIFSKNILNNKVDKYLFWAAFIDRDFKNEIVEKFERMKKNNDEQFNVDELYKQKKLVNFIAINRYKDNIKSSEDIYKLFKY